MNRRGIIRNYIPNDCKHYQHIICLCVYSVKVIVISYFKSIKLDFILLKGKVHINDLGSHVGVGLLRRISVQTQSPLAQVLLEFTQPSTPAGKFVGNVYVIKRQCHIKFLVNLGYSVILPAKTAQNMHWERLHAANREVRYEDYLARNSLK
jgi:hypothetical protein